MENPHLESTLLLDRVKRVEKSSTLLGWCVLSLTLACAALAFFPLRHVLPAPPTEPLVAAAPVPVASPVPVAAPAVQPSNTTPPKPMSQLPATAAPMPRIPDLLDVKAIRIKDASGQSRYKVEVNAQGELTESFYDANGKLRLLTSVSSQGAPSQSLYDQDGTARVRTLIAADHIAAFALLGTNGTPRYIAAITESDRVWQEFFDRQGVLRTIHTGGDDGEPAQSIRDPQGRARIASGVSHENAQFSIYDTNQICRVIAFADDGPDQQAAVVLRDRSGTNRFQLRTSDMLTAFQSLDERGKLRHQISTAHGDVGQIFLDGHNTIRMGTILDNNGKKENPAR